MTSRKNTKSKKKRLHHLVFKPLGALLVGFIGFLLYPVVITHFTNPITVSPDKLVIAPPKPFKKFDGKITEFPFSIINERNKYYSNIWVKLVLQISKDFKDTVIEFEPQSVDPGKTIKYGDRLICLNLFKILGFDDFGRKCIWLWIHSLKPRESIPFLLRLKNIPSIPRKNFKAVILFDCIGKPDEKMMPFSFDINSSIGTAVTYLQPPENIHHATRPLPLFTRKLSEKYLKMPEKPIQNPGNTLLLPK